MEQIKVRDKVKVFDTEHKIIGVGKVTKIDWWKPGILGDTIYWVQVVNGVDWPCGREELTLIIP